jgi:predicted HicB family RNase H-like nuclease
LEGVPLNFTWRANSAKFNVRVPKSLHAAVASEAEAVSLNQLVVAKLALRVQVR